jgi:hypothetical protein
MPYHILPSNTNNNHENAHQLPTGTQSNLCSSSTSSSYYYYHQQNSSSEIDVSKVSIQSYYFFFDSRILKSRTFVAFKITPSKTWICAFQDESRLGKINTTGR